MIRTKNGELTQHSRIYRVPENGHLKTKFTIKGSSIKSSDSTYFYVDKNDKRTKLKQYCEYCKDKDTVNIQVISGSLGTNNNHHFLDFVIDIPNYKNRNKDYSIQKTIDRLNNE
ncbi:DUF6843 domain-containing protein [Mucilaginibacter arboris]|uniref:DUF6843 domain-containing protein n=1 Tax=Mucilaginibacter arboris TaxID=2682090 RepID=A0A7K1T1C3_9SPHI|nr:hypothetical protein [Mucilaginibacter arboris]MVN23382.1 hypothetical protein [Mucilaginibacter arboris]